MVKSSPGSSDGVPTYVREPRADQLPGRYDSSRRDRGTGPRRAVKLVSVPKYKDARA
jgi:hypothetical protein